MTYATTKTFEPAPVIIHNLDFHIESFADNGRQRYRFCITFNVGGDCELYRAEGAAGNRMACYDMAEAYAGRVLEERQVY